MSRDWKIPPNMVVCSIAVLIVAFVTANTFLGKRSRMIDPRVTEAEGKTSQRLLNDEEVQRRVVVTATDGEVARTADRVGEASALALATSLYAATEQIKGRAPRTANDLIAGVAAQKLLPPGLSLSDTKDALVSDHGSLFVRYRLSPLGIEIVAIGREPRDGPALIVRVPDEAGNDGRAILFMATRLNDVVVPPAFVPAADIIAAGWSPEPLRSLK